ncbi:hypothetical protein RclHR1_14860002 [Rhizophagus clarus]|uniref:Uncharacterized protein n=1 Tax=Rhizophagus clarus TaxID=94130 RepID=A0A2Z6QDQ3_9GLOM|nr:hypothetical protein RclHR1_14860002 [Rhizophagus clarus]
MYRNSANVPQFRNYSAIELRYFAELRNICGIADNCGLRNCGYLGLKIRNVPQYRKSQLFRNCLFAAPSLDEAENIEVPEGYKESEVLIEISPERLPNSVCEQEEVMDSQSEQEETEDQPVASESVENLIDNFITELNTLIPPSAKSDQEPEVEQEPDPGTRISHDKMIDELYSTAKKYWAKYIDKNNSYNWDILLAELEEFDKIARRDNLYLVKFGDAIDKLKEWIIYNDNVNRRIKCVELANYLKRYNENKETVFVEPPSGYKVAKLQPQIIECHSQINERECMEANGEECESDYDEDGLYDEIDQI